MRRDFADEVSAIPDLCCRGQSLKNDIFVMFRLSPFVILRVTTL
jgi:hypothetical protein